MYRYSESVEVFFPQGEENLFFWSYSVLQARQGRRLRDGQQWRKAPDPAAKGGAGPSDQRAATQPDPTDNSWGVPPSFCIASQSDTALRWVSTQRKGQPQIKKAQQP